MIIAQNVQRHGTDRPLVTFHKYGKSLLFAIDGSVYQFNICSHVGTFPYRSVSTIKSKFKAEMRQEKLFRGDIISVTFRSGLDVIGKNR